MYVTKLLIFNGGLGVFHPKPSQYKMGIWRADARIALATNFETGKPDQPELEQTPKCLLSPSSVTETVLCDCSTSMCNLDDAGTRLLNTKNILLNKYRTNTIPQKRWPNKGGMEGSGRGSNNGHFLTFFALEFGYSSLVLPRGRLR